MKRIIGVILAAVIMVALPFIFRKPPEAGVWREGDPVLVVVTPHNEAIRQEFADGFSAWHERHYGRPARVDWRNIGGTTEIMRYLASEYIGSMEGWWERQGRHWPANGGSVILSATPPAIPDDADAAAREKALAEREIYFAFRTNDSPEVATARIDLFFGGGVFDHSDAERKGLTVRPWPTDADIPVGIFKDARGVELVPRELSGETCRSDIFFGNVLSTFGICLNPDRLRDLGFEADALPDSWAGLADPRLFGNVGVTDPTKSGSVAKAFEMIVQQTMTEHMHAAGWTEEAISSNETAIAATGKRVGEGDLAGYQADMAAGWEEGLNLIRLIGANARYFTDSAGKVPIDVGMGATAAGICIDFFGRFQAEYTRTADGQPHMTYVTPKGGSCVSADPISLLRGAEHRELAVRFIEFVFSVEGQRLWNTKVGAPGGPRKFALRRLPIRRDFYPSDDPVFNAAAATNALDSSDDLASPDINPFTLADTFTYRPRWSGRHFGVQRDLVRALCLDSGDELRVAWKAIIDHGGPDANPEAMALLRKLPTKPVPVTWESAVTDYRKIPRLQYMREWTAEMRANYRTAERIATATNIDVERGDGATRP